MRGVTSFLVVLGVFAATDASSSPLTLMSNLAKQSETLAHGLKVANLYGNLGTFYQYYDDKHLRHNKIYKKHIHSEVWIILYNFTFKPINMEDI